MRAVKRFRAAQLAAAGNRAHQHADAKQLHSAFRPTAQSTAKNSNDCGDCRSSPPPRDCDGQGVTTSSNAARPHSAQGRMLQFQDAGTSLPWWQANCSVLLWFLATERPSTAPIVESPPNAATSVPPSFAPPAWQPSLLAHSSISALPGSFLARLARPAAALPASWRLVSKVAGPPAAADTATSAEGLLQEPPPASQARMLQYLMPGVSVERSQRLLRDHPTLQSLSEAELRERLVSASRLLNVTYQNAVEASVRCPELLVQSSQTLQQRFHEQREVLGGARALWSTACCRVSPLLDTTLTSGASSTLDINTLYVSLYVCYILGCEWMRAGLHQSAPAPDGLHSFSKQGYKYHFRSCAFTCISSGECLFTP